MRRLRRQPAADPGGRDEGVQAAAQDDAARGRLARDGLGRACKSGEQAGADFGYSGPLTEICLLGNIAKRVDARIEWDAANMKVTNLPEANHYVRTEYRQGWTL